MVKKSVQEINRIHSISFYRILLKYILYKKVLMDPANPRSHDLLLLRLSQFAIK